MHSTIFINQIVYPRSATLIITPAAVLADTIKYSGFCVLAISSTGILWASCWFLDIHIFYRKKKVTPNEIENFFSNSEFSEKKSLPLMYHNQFQKQHQAPNPKLIGQPLKRSIRIKNNWLFEGLHNAHLPTFEWLNNH